MAKLKIDVHDLHKYYGENEVKESQQILRRGCGLHYRTVWFW